MERYFVKEFKRVVKEEGGIVMLGLKALLGFIGLMALIYGTVILFFLLSLIR